MIAILFLMIMLATATGMSRSEEIAQHGPIGWKATGTQVIYAIWV